MNRLQRILAVLLVVQIVVSAIALWPRKANTGGGGPLFAGLQAGDIVAMTLADLEGNTLRLRQVAGSWVLPDFEDYPCKADTVTQALGKIVALNTRRLVTRTSASHKRLQVSSDSFVRRVEFETSGDGKYMVYLGSSPTYGTTHVRSEGSDETYLAGDLTPWEFSPAPQSWVDTSYLSLARDQIRTIAVSNAKGRWTLRKEGEGQDAPWTLADLQPGEEPARDTINLLVSRASSVSLLKPLGKTRRPEYGLDDPLAVVTIEKNDGTLVTLLIGAQDPADKSYVVHASTSAYHVRVSEYAVKAFVENARSDLLAPQVTPTAKP